MRCLTSGVHAVGRLIALRGGRLPAMADGGSGMSELHGGRCGMVQGWQVWGLICFTRQPSLCCIPEPYGGKGLSFGAVRLARCKSQVK